MAHTPHELSEDFPDHAAKIHDLKMNDAHFARLADEYHKVNREVHRVETGIEAASQERRSASWATNHWAIRQKRGHQKA